MVTSLDYWWLHHWITGGCITGLLVVTFLRGATLQATSTSAEIMKQEVATSYCCQRRLGQVLCFTTAERSLGIVADID